MRLFTADSLYEQNEKMYALSSYPLCTVYTTQYNARSCSKRNEHTVVLLFVVILFLYNLFRGKHETNYEFMYFKCL